MGIGKRGSSGGAKGVEIAMNNLAILLGTSVRIIFTACV